MDGLWIDMNEPSNFCNGSCTSKDWQSSRASNLTGFNINNPPYYINNQDKFYPLNDKTLDVDSKQYGGHTFFDTHNLYGMQVIADKFRRCSNYAPMDDSGFTESIATRKALLSVNPDKRPFVLSRSTFPGSGVHTAHWLGDNTASSDDMYYSIPGMLNFQMFGIPLVGADICGFGGEKENIIKGLSGYKRWWEGMQLQFS